MSVLIEIRNLIEYAAREHDFAAPDAGYKLDDTEADLVLERGAERIEVTIRKLEP